jgi:hypothetical protein
MYCFCHPCVTTNRQIWLGNRSPPHARNSAIRKTKYKKFWTMMSVRCAWNHPRYIAKKAEKLNQGDCENIVWTLRELINAGMCFIFSKEFVSQSFRETVNGTQVVINTNNITQLNVI